MTQNQFLGTWRLVSCENRDADGQITYPYGEDAVGYITYTSDGYMFMTVTKANRSHFASADLFGGTIDEQAMAAQTYASYCGRYEVQTNKVIHHIEASLFPNWVGVDQQRFFEFTGNNRLSLSTAPFLVSGKQRTAHLIWERVSRNEGHKPDTAISTRDRLGQIASPLKKLFGKIS